MEVNFIMEKDLFPITHELMHIYITADRKRFFTRKEAEEHQESLREFDLLDGLPDLDE
tara:strand:- start:5120 stop:5293 length:174 start_codon:yes stop_codon:yes gene_type:complete